MAAEQKTTSTGAPAQTTPGTQITGNSQGQQPSLIKGSKRKIPCPYCTGQVESMESGRSTSNPTLFPRLQNILVAISEMITAVMGGSKTVSRKDAIGGKCEACDNKGSFDDPSDTSQEDAAAVATLEGQSEKIQELEGQMGTPLGGSRLARVAGDDCLVVGQAFNGEKHYTVVKDGLKVPGNLKVTEKGAAGVPSGGKSNYVKGKNLPTASGGNYTIVCSNSFKTLVGAAGISLKTAGPVTIDGGVTSFTGAEVTIGTKVGQTVVEGDHLLLKGKYITLNPMNDNKQVAVLGSLATTGNIQAGGMYADNLFFTKAVCPAEQKSSKVSSSTDLVTGPAQWTTIFGELNGLQLTLKNVIQWVTTSATDPTLSGATPPWSPRGILKIMDDLKHLIYQVSFIETKITGIGIDLAMGTPVIIFNFPHTHGMPDTPHSHVTVQPAIACESTEQAKSVRKAAEAAGINGPIPAMAMVSNYFGKLLSAGANLFTAIVTLGASQGTDGPYDT